MGRTSGLTPLKAAFGGQLTPQGVGTHGVEAFGRSGTHKQGGVGTHTLEVGHSQGDAGIMLMQILVRRSMHVNKMYTSSIVEIWVG